MVVVESGLLEKCKQESDRPQSVVITLCKGKEQTPLSTLDSPGPQNPSDSSVTRTVYVKES